MFHTFVDNRVSNFNVLNINHNYLHPLQLNGYSFSETNITTVKQINVRFTLLA